MLFATDAAVNMLYVAVNFVSYDYVCCEEGRLSSFCSSVVTPKLFISYRTATNNNVIAYINKVLLLSVYNESAEGREQITTKRYHRN